MKIVKVTEDFFDKCRQHNTDREILKNESGRPCVLLIQMLYKEKTHKFVVPFRSNISPTTPDNQYFHLPPNKNTKPQHSHGIHYIKIFPVTDKYIQKYLIENNEYCTMIQQIVDRNESLIIKACQEYLRACENGNKHPMTPDIEGILEWLYSDEAT